MMFRHWRLRKYSKLTGNRLLVSAPESKRLFWTRRKALQESQRLNEILRSQGFPQRYHVERI